MPLTPRHYQSILRELRNTLQPDTVDELCDTGWAERVELAIQTIDIALAEEQVGDYWVNIHPSVD